MTWHIILILNLYSCIVQVQNINLLLMKKKNHNQKQHEVRLALGVGSYTVRPRKMETHKSSKIFWKL